MKPFWAVILSSLIVVQSLVPRAYVGLLRSPEVWQHFKEHQAETKNQLGLWEFILMHYGSDSKHTKQKCHHLPPLDLSSAVGFFVLPENPFVVSNSPVFFTENEPNFFWLNLYSFNASNKLICPPRA